MLQQLELQLVVTVVLVYIVVLYSKIRNRILQ